MEQKKLPTPLSQIDAFVDGPFTGNPAAVCLLEQPADESWMQKVAAQLNLSETAFVTSREDGFDLRWFTPATEVELCGHATLASSHALWETGRLAPQQPARFFTRSGWLTCRQQDGLIQMDFPARAVQACAPAEGMLAALGLREAEFVGNNRMDYFVRVADEQTVRGLTPDMARLAKVDARGIIVTARSSSPEFDFVSRFFAPRVGVPEDPVTGSAHCALAPYWNDKLGKAVMRGYQASRRGGAVQVQVRGERVILAGRARTIWKGDLLV